MQAQLQERTYKQAATVVQEVLCHLCADAHAAWVNIQMRKMCMLRGSCCCPDGYLTQCSIDSQYVILLPQVLLDKIVQVWSVIPAKLFGTFDR